MSSMMKLIPKLPTKSLITMSRKTHQRRKMRQNMKTKTKNTGVLRRMIRYMLHYYKRLFVLVLLCIITAPVVLCIRQSLALSLGMVGALSIVRFRTAVKDPLDTAYMFWSLTMGILIGAGQFFLAAVAVIGIALLITIISRVASKPAETFLLVLRGEAGVEGDVTNLLRRLKHMRLKSKTLSGDGVEITYEIRLERQHDVLINKLLSIPGVQDATLVSYANETL